MGCSEYKIENVNGHYEVYINGHFYCSVDSIPEAVEELEKAMIKVERNNEH